MFMHAQQTVNKKNSGCQFCLFMLCRLTRNHSLFRLPLLSVAAERKNKHKNTSRLPLWCCVRHQRDNLFYFLVLISMMPWCGKFICDSNASISRNEMKNVPIFFIKFLFSLHVAIFCFQRNCFILSFALIHSTIDFISFILGFRLRIESLELQNEILSFSYFYFLYHRSAFIKCHVRSKNLQQFSIDSACPKFVFDTFRQISNALWDWIMLSTLNEFFRTNFKRYFIMCESQPWMAVYSHRSESARCILQPVWWHVKCSMLEA